VIRASLHADLRARLTAHVALDLDRGCAEEITRVVAAVVEHAQRARERDLLRRLGDALATGGPAVTGLDAVLASLRQRRIETLVVADGAQLTAGLCPRCGRLSSTRERRCPLHGAGLAPVDAVDLAIERAKRQRADVVVFCHESAGLREHGSIAALLHW
jgi:peptide subunit release factor 1 (eRF1)